MATLAFNELKKAESKHFYVTLQYLKAFYVGLLETFVPANIYLFKVNNRNITAISKIRSKLTKTTPEKHHWRLYNVFIVNYEQISLVILFPLQTLKN